MRHKANCCRFVANTQYWPIPTNQASKTFCFFILLLLSVKPQIKKYFSCQKGIVSLRPVLFSSNLSDGLDPFARLSLLRVFLFILNVTVSLTHLVCVCVCLCEWLDGLTYNNQGSELAKQLNLRLLGGTTGKEVTNVKGSWLIELSRSPSKEGEAATATQKERAFRALYKDKIFLNYR